MNSIQPIFDPATYAKVRQPLEQANHLPPWCYTSDAFYEREVRRIFMKEWNFMGRADHLGAPGDYTALDFAGIPLIILRDSEGGLRAFANNCPHRGACLLAGEGRVKRIGCPYHGWSFSLEGELVAAPGMDGIDGFEMGDHGLKPIRLETWQGFVFINFDAGAPGLMDYLGDLTDEIGSYNFADMTCTRRVEFDLDCNWKLYIENAMEDYHTAVVHRASIKKQVARYVDTKGQWEAAHVASPHSLAVLSDAPKSFPHIPSLEGATRDGTYFVMLYPSTMWGCAQDCMWWLELRPQGAARTKLIVGSCFPNSTIVRDDFEEVAAHYYHRWDKSIPEDNDIAEIQQHGLSSPLSETGRVSRMELLVHRIANWTLDRVLDAPAAT